jgi:hypothetical protein
MSLWRRSKFKPVNRCKKKIAQAKGKPILRTELERRYQQDCIDVRYYRDDHQTEVCGHDGKVKEATISPVTNNNN